MSKCYTYDFSNNIDMLNKLRAYTSNPDDDNIRIKNQIKDLFLHCPELLYALNDKELENELFNIDGSLNVDENGEPLGEWDRYFGDTSLIRPFLFVPNIQTDTKNYICYQTSYSNLVNGNNMEKKLIITFTIIINGHNKIDNLTGIPRHDLIAGIIREKMAWIGLDISTPIPISDVETTTDKNYLVRTIEYLVILPNSITKTKNNINYYNNKGW